MNIVLQKERADGEKRVALIPLHAGKLAGLGATIEIEKGFGSSIGIEDSEYEKAGCSISADIEASVRGADMILGINIPEIETIQKLKAGCIYLGNLDPYNQKDVIGACVSSRVSAISVEMIPRTTRAQKMDVLSSQANLGGYVAVILAAERLSKVLPMMMTPAGTIAPSRVFIIGAGVAGLQAIATAKRLGARVEAFDTRPVVAEQVQSLGAKFVHIDLGETGQTKDGYAKALTPEQLEMQRKGIAKVCAQSDVVITTAQIPGKKAPRIINREMISAMNPGSIIVDMAVTSGGNVEGSEVDKEVVIDGVTVIGLKNFPARVASHASQMLSSNYFNFIAEFWNKDAKKVELKMSDEIIAGCLITSNGEITNEAIKQHHS